jgi:hypothetical protein
LTNKDHHFENRCQLEKYFLIILNDSQQPDASKKHLHGEIEHKLTVLFAKTILAAILDFRHREK